MLIHQIATGPLQTNTYVICCPETKSSAVIDPGVDSLAPIESYLNSSHLEKILLTHSHWDHIGDAAVLKRKHQASLFIHSLDAPNLQNPGADNVPCWLPINGAIPDILIDETTSIQLGSYTFSVIHTPGHSPGGVCYYCASAKILFSGDTLFKGTIGNLALPTSEPDKMWTSLKKLAKLPPHTTVYPGHGPTTTIGEEPWLSCAKQHFS